MKSKDAYEAPGVIGIFFLIEKANISWEFN